MFSDLKAAAGENVRLPIKRIIVTLVLAAGAYLVLAVLADWQAVIGNLARIPAANWPLLLVLSLLSYSARALRWHYYLQQLGQGVGFWVNFRIYLAGLALTATPGKVGETVRSLLLKPWGVPYAQSLAAFFCERLLDVLVVAMLAMLVVTWFPNYRDGVLLAAAAFLMVAIVLRNRGLQLLLRRIPWRRLRHGGHNFAEIVGHLLGNRLLMPGILLGTVSWLAQATVMWLLVSWMLGSDALSLSWSLAVGVYCLSILAGALSLIPGGLGATESAMAALLVLVGVPTAVAVSAALLCRVVTLWLAISLGVVSLAASLSPRRQGKNEAAGYESGRADN